MKLNLSYERIQDAVQHSNVGISAAEAHGVLAGMLCVYGGVEREQWLAAVFGEADADLSEDDYDVLLGLCEQTRLHLGENDCSFELFLPGDDTELQERAHALAQWCQGFLYGLGYLENGAGWPGESGEVLRDLAEISQLDSEAAGEADEVAYMEISEFVRVGVQLIHGEFQEQQQPQRLH